MSFADEVRAELCALPVKKNCCRRALTAGLLSLVRAVDGKRMAVRYQHETVAALATEMIRQQYAKAPEIAVSGACGHVYYDLTFSSPACYRQSVQLFSPDAEIAQILPFACDSCRGAFLRGLFLACGTVNDPHKSFHLEFALPVGAEIRPLSRFLADCGYPPRSFARQGSVGLYYKDGGSVEDLIGMAGAQHTVFEIINSRIEREIRNNENRATNCVAKNIEKTISAATRQMEAIDRLLETGRMESLPEALRTTAMVRYRNPDATLDELVRLHEPPISKSGLNHRLKKLLEEAEELST
ncbi:MAG: DNA-binding protein WhiA [Clostridia bacterium]|nr:DNA-binding protein WhiA [Clostridia bacterium]